MYVTFIRCVTVSWVLSLTTIVINISFLNFSLMSEGQSVSETFWPKQFESFSTYILARKGAELLYFLHSNKGYQRFYPEWNKTLFHPFYSTSWTSCVVCMFSWNPHIFKCCQWFVKLTSPCNDASKRFCKLLGLWVLPWIPKDHRLALTLMLCMYSQNLPCGH